MTSTAQTTGQSSAPEPGATGLNAPGQGQRTHVLSYRRFLVFALIGMAVAVAPVLVWQLSHVLLFAFGAVLVALLLQVVAEPLQRWTPLPDWATLLISGLLVLALLLTAAWVFGSELANEFADVTKRIGSASRTIEDQLSQNEAGKFVVAHFKGADISFTSMLPGVFSLGVSTAEALVVIVISAVYIVAQPHEYRRGFTLLFPPRLHQEVCDTLDEVGRALRLWLIGQFIQMALIGSLSALAVWLIGLPSVLALGMIAAVTEFVPYIGPIVAAVPAILVALTQSPQAALFTTLAYLIIHQIEGNVIAPMIQRWMVVIPPALTLLGIAAIGTLFGFAGVVFAGPIVVTLYIATRKLYVRDLLGENIPAQV